ncbi:50S ribosomal protein L13 [archaeon]|nr:50S ribosomal protein L13 [archaeon]
MIIDANELIAGRMATGVAKKALLGEKIDIVNCENALITGKKKEIFERFKVRRDRGDALKGPYNPTMSDRFIRRMIRGMLPYKQEKGRLAFKRVMCYLGVPDEFKDKKFETIKSAHISKSKTMSYTTIGELCKHLKK